MSGTEPQLMSASFAGSVTLPSPQGNSRPVPRKGIPRRQRASEISTSPSGLQSPGRTRLLHVTTTSKSQVAVFPAASVAVQVTLVRPNGKSMPHAGTQPTKSPTQEPLVTALARAFHWQELLDTGRYRSVTELAEALALDRSYVGRILRLTLLAPDIVEAIVQGREPSGLSLKRLTRRLPVAWAEQRRWFGFAGR